MGTTRPNVPDAEWAVLEALWEKGPATVQALMESLYPDGGASKYATVHRLLERLEEKGHVARDRGTGVYLFRAVADREALLGRQFEALVDRMCGGSLQPLLSHLVRSKRISPEDLRSLLDLVDGQGGDQPSPPRPE
jgi:predicted transcriptional regulator